MSNDAHEQMLEDAGRDDMAYDPVFRAIARVEAATCTCHHVDVGIGSQKVSEDPECPVCTEYGRVALYLADGFARTRALREYAETLNASAPKPGVGGYIAEEILRLLDGAVPAGDAA
jgi:hypothetical protein